MTDVLHFGNATQQAAEGNAAKFQNRGRDERAVLVFDDPASASTQPKRMPEAMTWSISSIAISGVDMATYRFFGMRARVVRSRSLV